MLRMSDPPDETGRFYRFSQGRASEQMINDPESMRRTAQFGSIGDPESMRKIGVYGSPQDPESIRKSAAFGAQDDPDSVVRNRASAGKAEASSSQFARQANLDDPENLPRSATFAACSSEQDALRQGIGQDPNSSATFAGTDGSDAQQSNLITAFGKQN